MNITGLRIATFCTVVQKFAYYFCKLVPQTYSKVKLEKKLIAQQNDCTRLLFKRNSTF